MSQKGLASLTSIVIIVAGLVIGVYFIERGTGVLSQALEIIGPSKSATLKIPVRSPQPALATDSAKLATGSAKPASSSAKPKAAASASASVKPSATSPASPR